jgi:hypothetical protein
MKPIYQYAAGFVLGVTLPLVVICLIRKPEPRSVPNFVHSGWSNFNLSGATSVKAYRVTDNTVYCENYRNLFALHKVSNPKPPPALMIGNSRVVEGPVTLDQHFATELSNAILDRHQFQGYDDLTQPIHPEVIDQWSIGNQKEEVDVSISEGRALTFIYRDILHPTSFYEGTIGPQFVQLAQEEFPRRAHLAAIR